MNIVAGCVASCNNIQLILYFTDASSSNEAVHLQQRLKSLSTELLTLRNRLHVGPTAGTGGGVTGTTIVNSVNNNTIGNGNSNNNTIHSSTTTVNNTTSSPVIPITNSNKLNNKVNDSLIQFRFLNKFACGSFHSNVIPKRKSFFIEFFKKNRLRYDDHYDKKEKIILR